MFFFTLFEAIFIRCLENPEAEIVKVQTKNKSKWRPVPLDTVVISSYFFFIYDWLMECQNNLMQEMEKLASRKLRISAKETMKIAEKLYTQGFISYPRTETNIFPKELDLRPLVEMQVRHAFF